MAQDISSLSLFHKILIFVEDKGSIQLKDLSDFGNIRQMLGALGRLEGLDYIERSKAKDDTVTFSLTDKGDEVIADMLDTFSEYAKPWDHKWRIILFDIPESERTIRQNFRLKLLDLGARMLQSSVWITPHVAVVNRFKACTDEATKKEVYYFEAATLPGSIIDVKKLWQLETLAEEYNQLFKQFNQEIRAMKGNSLPSHKAKWLIVQLALLNKKDPRLPQEYMPKNWIGYEANTWYQKLRSFCK